MAIGEKTGAGSTATWPVTVSGLAVGRQQIGLSVVSQDGTRTKVPGVMVDVWFTPQLKPAPDPARLDFTAATCGASCGLAAALVPELGRLVRRLDVQSLSAGKVALKASFVWGGPADAAWRDAVKVKPQTARWWPPARSPISPSPSTPPS